MQTRAGRYAIVAAAFTHAGSIDQENQARDLAAENNSRFAERADDGATGDDQQRVRARRFRVSKGRVRCRGASSDPLGRRHGRAEALIRGEVEYDGRGRCQGARDGAAVRPSTLAETSSAREKTCHRRAAMAR